MKKVVSILLALAMALTCLCGSAFAAKEGKVTIWDGVFPLQKGKIYIINQNTVLSRDVVIPVSSTLIIKNNATLKIPAEHSVTVKGTLKINPKGRIWLFGTLSGTEKSAINVYGSINTATGTEINICGKLNVYKSGKIVGHGEINPSTFLGITNGGKITVDINDLVESFADTPAGRWLAKNAVDYGFILRYPKGKSDITGYSYEPWHFRYVGTELAKMIDDSGLTLEEFLGVA